MGVMKPQFCNNKEFLDRVCMQAVAIVCSCMWIWVLIYGFMYACLYTIEDDVSLDVDVDVQIVLQEWDTQPPFIV